MSRKAFHALFLGLIAFGTTSANADDIKQWVQDNGQSSKMVGVQTGGIIAATSLATGKLVSALELEASKSFIPRADMNNSLAFKRAAESFIWGQDHATHELPPLVDQLNEAKRKLETVSKNQGSSSGAAILLQHRIDNLQSSVSQLELRISQLQDKIDDVHKYLASGGKAVTRLSVDEQFNIDRYVQHYQRDLKVSALWRKAAADSEKRAEKSLMGGVKGMLLGIPVGAGATLIDEKLRERTIASEKVKAQADSHSEFSQIPVVSGSANAEAK